MTIRPMITPKTAVVLPRYGDGLGGGAETLTKALIERAFQAGLISEIEVWSTCARDHRTWENYYPEGQTVENGIAVTRFPVDIRDTDIFVPIELEIQAGHPISVSKQLDWLSESVNSKALYQHIVERGKDFDVLLFAPYLFATSFWGSLIYPEKSVVIPCLHDECYAYLPVFAYQLQAVRGLLFNAAPEQALAEELYSTDFSDCSAVVGMGFDSPKREKLPATLRPANSYILYSGRKEQGKNLDLLISYFEQFKSKNTESNLELVIIGAGEISFLETLPAGVTDLGFVSEEEKLSLMQNALILCQPSLNESFSIVMMEAWLQGTPVLVHGKCDVTAHHVESSGGGFSFTSEAEFDSCIRKLTEEPELRAMLAANGKTYVETEYSWEAVFERFSNALETLGFVSEVEVGDARTV